LDTGTGSLIEAAVSHPYEIVTTRPNNPARGALGDKRSFMGSGRCQADVWVTARIYDHLFDELAPSGGPLMTVSAAEDVVLASGWIGEDDSVELEPWYHLTTTLGTTVTGTYAIEAVDEVSQTLASQGFELYFALDGPLPQDLDVAPFEVVVPFPAGTAAFLVKRDSAVLQVVPVSPGKPAITVTSPVSGSVVSRMHAIEWASHDPDLDQLYHTVEYSPNGADWLTLASAITETQLLANFDRLPGGSQARVRVTVSDGVNTTQAIGDAFWVTDKLPSVLIESPLSGATYLSGENVELHGIAHDLQDGWLGSDAALVWRSDRDGVLGRGELLNLSTLSPGEHTITLSATNSLGLTASASTRVTIRARLYLPAVWKDR
jgi:hypothetical protein